MDEKSPVILQKSPVILQKSPVIFSKSPHNGKITGDSWDLLRKIHEITSDYKEYPLIIIVQGCISICFFNNASRVKSEKRRFVGGYYHTCCFHWIVSKRKHYFWLWVYNSLGFHFVLNLIILLNQLKCFRGQHSRP